VGVQNKRTSSIISVGAVIKNKENEINNDTKRVMYEHRSVCVYVHASSPLPPPLPPTIRTHTRVRDPGRWLRTRMVVRGPGKVVGDHNGGWKDGGCLRANKAVKEKEVWWGSGVSPPFLSPFSFLLSAPRPFLYHPHFFYHPPLFLFFSFSGSCIYYYFWYLFIGTLLLLF
jgi:hypothetical protein